MSPEFIRLAHKQSLKSLFRQRVGAVLVKHGKLLSTGHNVVKCDIPLATEHWDGSVHAEMMCCWKLIKQGKMKQIEGSTLYVVRTLRSGQLGLALPCSPCYRVLCSLGVKNVFFSNDDGLMSEIRL